MQLENYRIILTAADAKRILLMGYLGVSLFIRGDLRFSVEPEILAEQIDFMHFPENNQQQPTFIFNDKNADRESQQAMDIAIHQLFQHAQQPLHEYCH